MNRSLLFRLTSFLAVFFLLSVVNSELQAQPPDLSSPIDGDVCVVAEAVLDWDPAPAALSYSYQVSDLADFSNILFEGLGISETEITLILDPGTKYYWRAAANYPGPTTDWSDPWSFTIINAPPTFVNPADNAVCVPVAIDFEWAPVPTAATYDIQVSPNTNFTTLIIDETGLSGTTYSGSVPNYNTNYYWRVKAVFADCSTEWSQAGTFTSILAPAALASPNDDTVGIALTIDLEWSATSGASDYDIQVDNNQDFSSPEISETGLTSTTYTATLTDNNTVHYWRVRSVSSNCTSDWPGEWSFLTKYSKAVLTVPADSAECVPLATTVGWDTVPGASKYIIQVAADENFTDLVVNDSALTSTTYAITLPSPVTTYYWRVKAEDENNTGPWSEVRSFVSAISAPNLISPANNSAGLPLENTFEWENIAAGAVYLLQVATDVDFDNIVLDKAGLDENSFTATLPGFNTIYYWRVTATSTGCSSVWSDVWQLRTVLPAPELISPANNATNQSLSPILVWENLADAATYDFELAYDSDFENHVSGKGKTGIPINTITPSSLKVTTQYFWRIRASNSDGTSQWSVVFNFTTGQLGPEVPVLVSPADDETKVPIAVTFSWKAADRASYYHIEIADNSQLISPIISESNITTNSYDASGLANYTEYWWRVASINDSGMSKWSEPWLFRTIAIPPTDQIVLLSPANDLEKAPLNLIFKWGKVDRADAYEFQLATDNGFENLFVDNNNVWKTELNVIGLEENTQYFWRTRAKNEAGNSPWSEIWNLTTGMPSSVPFEVNSTTSVYPNPFAESAYLSFELKSGTNVAIKMLDVLGNEVKTIANGFMEAGNKNILINSASLPSGVYLISIMAGDHVEIQRIVVSK